MQCPSCSSQVPGGARFCPTCGHLLVETEERRVVTVLFADLVGFTGLSQERDPEQVKHLIDRCFQRLVADITAFGGTVDKIIGDGIIALFGAPKAHEDDPERAVRAGLRMQRTIAEMGEELKADIRMRVGVNTGEVVVGAIRAGGDYTAMGDTVNLTSRLEGLAEPGQVLVGASTEAATRGAVRYEPKGTMVVRGRDEPIQVFVAITEIAPPGRRQRTVRAPMVGRNIELLQMTSAVDTAVARQRAHLLLILGEGGMGKSRLAEEVATAAEASHTAAVLEGRVLPYGETNPYRPVAEAIQRAAEITPSDSAEQAARKLKALARAEPVAEPVAEGEGGTGPERIAEGEPPDGAEAGAAAVDPDLDPDSGVGRVLNGLLHLLGYATPLRGYEPARASEEVQFAIQHYLQACARRRPLVLVLGDINWADTPLLELLELLLRRLVALPFVVVATARWSVEDERWQVPPGRHNTTVLNLDPLNRQASRRLLRSLLGSEVSDDVVDLLHDRSGGNPFFLEELASLLSEAGVDGSDPAGPVDLPDTLRGLVATRIDALTPDERNMVEDASVVGRSGPVYALLLMARDHGSGDAEYTFRRLVEKDIFETSEQGWRFRSDLVREVAYSTLTKAARARRHHGIAVWLASHYDDRGDVPAGVVAGHFLSAAELVDELGPIDGVPDDLVDQAVTWLVVAGQRATEHDSYYASGSFFARALEVLPAGDPRRIEPLLGRTEARLGLRELSDATADATEALDLARNLGDRRAEAQSLGRLGEAAQAENRLDSARNYQMAAIMIWGELNDDSGLANALRRHGMAAMSARDLERAEDDLTTALALFSELGDPAGEAWCRQNLAWLAFERGRLVEAEERLARSIELFESVDDQGGLGWAQGLQAYLHFHLGRLGEAEALATDTLQKAQERGDRFGESMMRLLIGSLRLWAGDVVEAVELGTEARRMFEQGESPFGILQALGVLVRAHASLGETELSRRSLDELLELGEQLGEPNRQLALIAAAGAAVQVGDGGRALALLDELAPLLPGEEGEQLGGADRLITRAVALLQVGRVDDAVHALDEAEARTADGARSRPRHLAPNAYLGSSQALAQVAAGRVDDGRRLADEVLGHGSFTYLDSRNAMLAKALGAARSGDVATARTEFAAARAMVDATTSQLSQAVVRLAEAVTLDGLGEPDGPELCDQVRDRLAAIDIDAGGWIRLFTIAALGERPVGQP